MRRGKVFLRQHELFRFYWFLILLCAFCFREAFDSQQHLLVCTLFEHGHLWKA